MPTPRPAPRAVALDFLEGAALGVALGGEVGSEEDGGIEEGEVEGEVLGVVVANEEVEMDEAEVDVWVWV